MTLAVAKVVGSRVAVVSDTLITEHGKALSVQSGVIKSCMLPGGICVSFCNSPDTAAIAMREFVSLFPHGANYSEVVFHFERSSVQTGNDYLVSFSNPARVVKIVDGHATRSVASTQWIGDKDAFEAFRGYTARKRERPHQGRAINNVMFMDELPESPASDLYSAMRDVVNDQSVRSVGGLVTTIGNREDGFRYSVYSDMLFDFPADRPYEFDLALTDRLSFQVSGENTDYSITQISPGYLGLNLVGYYFAKAQKLFFFHGDWFGVANKCAVFDAVPASEIQNVLNRAVGRDLGWLLTVMAPHPAGPYRGESSGIETPGIQLAMFCHANTFPPTPK